MVKAIYGKLFTDFNFEKYENYLNEMQLLYDNWDFGKRYQELYDLFHTPNYNFEFYDNVVNDDILDALADKIDVQ